MRVMIMEHCAAIQAICKQAHLLNHPTQTTPYFANTLVPQSSQIRRSKRLYNTRTLTESRPEYPVRVLKHAILQTDDDELTSLEPRLDESTNVLGMGQIESGIDLVQNVHRSRFALKKGEDERERNK